MSGDSGSLRQGGTPPAERLRTHSLRRRVVALVLLLLALLLALLAATTHVALRERLRGQLEQRLVDRAAVAGALVDQVDGDTLVRRIAGDGVSVRLVTADGQVIEAGPLAGGETGVSESGPAPLSPPGGPPDGPAGPAGPVAGSGGLLEVSRDLDGGAVVTVTASTSQVDDTLSQVRWVVALGSIAVLAIAAALLVPVVSTALRPLSTMTATARAIAAGDRGRRLDPDDPATELGRTAAAFDDMLDVVQGAESQAKAAEHRLREFISDAAHELRTPLAGVQAAAEHLLRNNPERRDREQLTVTVIREALRASRLVDDMLTMARIDAGLPLQLADAELLGLAETVAQNRRAASGSQIAVGGERVPVRADPDRVIQVLNNLVDNAVRAAGRAGTVEIVTSSHPVPSVEVTDSGPGVPAGSEERIFDRLVRLDHARDRDRGGAGLGLPIARGIARAHGGDLVCLPSDAGAHFRLTLPAG